MFATGVREHRILTRTSTGAFVIRDESSAADRITIAPAGNVTINAPSSGVPLTVTAVSGGGPGIQINGASGSAAYLRLQDGGAGARQYALTVGTVAAGTFSIFDETATTSRLNISSAGNHTIPAPSSGVGLTIGGGGATVTGTVTATAFSGPLTGNASTATALQTARTINGTSFNGTADITVTAAAGTLTGTTLPALNGSALTALNATQLTSGTVPAARITSVDAGATINSVAIGYRTIPQNPQAGNYTAVIGDSGFHIYHASGDGAGDTYTIPANASVAYPVGTVLTFVNSDSNSVSIAITTDTMTLAGTTTTGTRTLAQNGVATALKVTSTAWIISGTGLT
jgi:hypothetical protein